MNGRDNKRKRINEYKLIKTNVLTPRDEKIEFPSLTREKSIEVLLDVQNNNSPTVRYYKVEIEIESPCNILIVPLMDTQFGSRYTTMTSDFQSGHVGNWEAEFRPFPTFGDQTKADDAKSWVELNPQYTVILPDAYDVTSPNFVAPPEHE